MDGATTTLIERFAQWETLRFDANRCPVRSVLDRVGEKWATPLLEQRDWREAVSARSRVAA